MLLNKLESGFLLFQTEQGLVAVEPSFWQRVYLLWTFRNFRQLSPPLLNPRQATLINSLFREQGTVVSDPYEPSLQIGVVEYFVPPATEIGAVPAIGAAPAAEADTSPATEANLPERTAEHDLAPPALPIPAAPTTEADAPPAFSIPAAPALEADAPPAFSIPAVPAMEADLPPEISVPATTAMGADAPPAVKWQEAAEADGARIDRAEIALSNSLDRSFAPAFSWPTFSWLTPASSHPATSTPAASPFQVPRMAISMVAAAVGALSLCVGFAFAFHRIGGVPVPQAHISPPQLSSPDSPSAPEPTSVAQNPDPAPDSPAPEPTSAAANPDPAPNAPSQPEAGHDAGPDTAEKPTSAQKASAIPATHRATTPVRASRGGTSHVASRPNVASKSSGVPHAAAFSRVPASTSTRRMTVAPAPHGATAPSAQRYFDLANEQMHKGNYAAAAADYKLAWRMQEKNAAAKGRLVRARRATQPQKHSIPSRQ